MADYNIIAPFAFVLYLLLIGRLHLKEKKNKERDQAAKVTHVITKKEAKVATIQIEQAHENLLTAISKLTIEDGELNYALQHLLLSYDLSTDFVSKLLREELQVGISNAEVVDLLKARILSSIENQSAKELENEKGVILMTGINGAGKTTACVKLGNFLKAKGKKVLMVPADTFRAAAIEQLQSMSQKYGLKTSESKMGADPASIAFKAIEYCEKIPHDQIIVDTSGRLDTNINLMKQLEKIKKVIEKKSKLLASIYVYDCRVGLSGIEQTKKFNDVIGIDSILITKLDAVMRPGIVFELLYELSIPISHLSDSEKIDGLKKFDLKGFTSNF
jgi:fused signal recognition particle receptor